MLTGPHIRTPLPGPRAAELIARDRRFVSPSYTRGYPLVIARGEGAVVEDVVAYRTIEGPPSSRQILHDALASGDPNAVVLASGSAARGLVALARAEGLDVGGIPAICIGPETHREARRLGFHLLATSPDTDPSTLAATTAGALAHPLETR